MNDHADNHADDRSARTDGAGTTAADQPGGTTGANQAEGTTGYAQAVAELEAILGRLEHDDVDVDVLAAEVGRAAELIAMCRDRIHHARTEVERVVSQLAEEQE